MMQFMMLQMMQKGFRKSQREAGSSGSDDELIGRSAKAIRTVRSRAEKKLDQPLPLIAQYVEDVREKLGAEKGKP